MKCPSCQIELKIAERQGVEIDYCPQCRGVWLDRGELDKIVERASGPAPSGTRGEYGSQEWRGDAERREYDDDDRGYRPGYRSGKPRRRSFLGDLFDFD